MSYKLDWAEITNFKGLKHKVVEIGGKSFFISGKNGKGKSSLIQALNAAFSNSSIPPEPVTKGEEKAVVKIRLSGKDSSGKEKEYTVQAVFSDKDDKGKITVYNSDMEKVSTQKSFVKDLFEYISFDILEFLRMKPVDQVKKLKELAGEEFMEKLDALDAKYKELYKQRAAKNSYNSEMEAKLKNHGYTDAEVDKYLEPVDATILQGKMAEISKKQADWNRINSGVTAKMATIESNQDIVAMKEVQIARLQEEVNNLKNANGVLAGEVNKGKQWLDQNKYPENTQLQADIEEANKHNIEHARISQYVNELEELNKSKEQAQDMTAKLEKINGDKIKLLNESPLPVKGLSFTEDSPLYNGLPLDENQIERSMLIKIGAEIAMAMNPTLKVVSIQDGSLLDKESVEFIVNLCKEKDYQLIMEIVGEESEPTIEFIEREIKKENKK